jgi:ADP-heptose:LPS heptosyltransferase
VGTSRQILPPEWAAKHLPKAVFAFFHNDRYEEEFRHNRLHTVTYQNLEELVAVGLCAKKTICTDSFPLHLGQIYGADITLMLSQQTPERVVHPVYDGKTIVSQAACCICLPQAHGLNPSVCESGFVYCQTWEKIDSDSELSECE